MHCQIQWIDCDGRSTAHDAQAVAYAVHKGVRYLICAAHLETLKGRRSHHSPDCPHLGGFYFAGLWHVEPLVDPDLAKRYRWFREHGCNAQAALYDARIEQVAEKRGLRAVWEYEDESYESVYGDPMPENADGPFWVWVPHPGKPSEPRDRRWPIASLGMVTLAKDGSDNGYRRIVAAELFSEALDVLDSEDSEQAETLAQRATYAGAPSCL